MNRPTPKPVNAASALPLRLWVLYVGLVLIMQFSDPLGDVALADAAFFWSVRLLGAAASLVVAHWACASLFVERWNAAAWFKPAVLTMLIAAVPMTCIEVFLETVIPPAAAYDDSTLRATSPLLAFLGEYLTIVSVILPINLFLWIVLDRQPAETEQELEASPSFLSKTAGIQIDDVIALAAEEHYVRVLTPERSELVYGRLRDAIAEMPDSRGLQVHRSWWVAQQAVVAAHRGERRYELELVDGTRLPVSDRFTASARERGLLVRRPPANA